MSCLSLLRWIDHPAARVLGLVFLVRDLVVAVLAVGAFVTGALADGGALQVVAVVLGALALAGVVISPLTRRNDMGKGKRIRRLRQEAKKRDTASSTLGSESTQEASPNVGPSFIIGGPGTKVGKATIEKSYSNAPQFGGICGAEIEEGTMRGNVHDPQGISAKPKEGPESKKRTDDAETEPA